MALRFASACCVNRLYFAQFSAVKSDRFLTSSLRTRALQSRAKQRGGNLELS